MKATIAVPEDAHLLHTNVDVENNVVDVRHQHLYSFVLSASQADDHLILPEDFCFSLVDVERCKKGAAPTRGSFCAPEKGAESDVG